MSPEAAVAKKVYAWAIWLCTQVVTVGLLLIFTTTVLGLFGFRTPFVRAIDFTPLAYLCGAWWLYRKA